MSRKHAVIVVVLLAAAAAFGLFGLARTLEIGSSASATRVPDAVIAKRNRALDRFEVALRRQLARKPPKLPPVPKVGPAGASSTRAVAQAGPTSTPAVRYVRPAPIIVHKPSQHEDDREAEADDGGRDD
jgi:hypothetical protein